MKKNARLILALALMAVAPAALQAACGEDCEQACCSEGQQTSVTKATPADAKLTKVDYQVKGLACADCEGKVTTALNKIGGVGSVTACSVAKEVKISYDARKVKEKDLMAAIQKAGFKVDAETVSLKVDGMACGACSAKVGTTLTQIKGVQEQKVSHEDKNAVVTFDPAKVSREQVIAAIEKTGFKVVQ